MCFVFPWIGKNASLFCSTWHLSHSKSTRKCHVPQACLSVLHTHTWRCGFARAKNHSATEKRRKVKFLLFFFFFSLRAPLMCPADSETGFGRRHRRGSQPRWPPNIRAKRRPRRLRWNWNGLSPDERAGGQMSLFCFHHDESRRATQ